MALQNLAHPALSHISIGQTALAQPDGIAGAVKEGRIPVFAEVTERVFFFQEVAARPHPVNHIQSHCLRADFDTPQNAAHQADDFVVHHRQFHRSRQSIFDITHIVGEIAPGQRRGQNPQRPFQAGLLIKCLGVGAAAEAENGQPVVASQVAQGGHIDPELRCSIRNVHMPHIHNCNASAIDERSPFSGQLGNDQAAEQFGIGDQQPTGTGRRRYRPEGHAGSIDYWQALAGHVHQLGCAVYNVLQWRDRLRVQNRERIAAKRLRSTRHNLTNLHDVF